MGEQLTAELISDSCLFRERFLQFWIGIHGGGYTFRLVKNEKS